MTHVASAAAEQTIEINNLLISLHRQSVMMPDVRFSTVFNMWWHKADEHELSQTLQLSAFERC